MWAFLTHTPPGKPVTVGQPFSQGTQLEKSAKLRFKPNTARPQALTRRDPRGTQPPVAVLGGSPRCRPLVLGCPRLQFSRTVLALRSPSSAQWHLEGMCWLLLQGGCVVGVGSRPLLGTLEGACCWSKASVHDVSAFTLECHDLS